MASWFDESRLDDERVLAPADPRLRALAEAGARVRREAVEAAAGIAAAVATARDIDRPRAIVAAGPDSRLLRAVLEPWCPVPFVAWPGPALPGWAGGLDLVVVLAPDGTDLGTAAAVAEAVRRGCQVVVACPAGSLVAQHAEGRGRRSCRPSPATSWPRPWSCSSTSTRSTSARAPTTARRPGARRRGPRLLAPPRPRGQPRQDAGIALADTYRWSGAARSLAARAARRVSESIRRASGQSAIAGDAEHLLPLIEAAGRATSSTTRSPTRPGELRPMLLMLDDGADDPVVREQRGRLQAAAAEHGVRIEIVTTRPPPRSRATPRCCSTAATARNTCASVSSRTERRPGPAAR